MAKQTYIVPMTEDELEELRNVTELRQRAEAAEARVKELEAALRHALITEKQAGYFEAALEHIRDFASNRAAKPRDYANHGHLQHIASTADNALINCPKD